MSANLQTHRTWRKPIRSQSRRRSFRRSPYGRWAVILAGGDGTRLKSMTRAISGDDRPKQFCPLIGGQTLLDQTRQRVAMSVSTERTLFVVTKKHERFYQTLPKETLVEQPANKGTAPAIIYALLRVARKSPQATVALFPSDHFFADDEAFMSHVDVAFDVAVSRPETVTLLGITPSNPETEYGWIESEPAILAHAERSITRVRRFWEKPSAAVARRLMSQGCLWNSFVMVGRVDKLLQMTRAALPQLVDSFASIVPWFDTAGEACGIEEVYEKLVETNFSHEVLASRPNDLTVLKVGEVGWSDLGEPQRVFSTLARIGVQAELAMPAS